DADALRVGGNDEEGEFAVKPGGNDEYIGRGGVGDAALHAVEQVAIPAFDGGAGDLGEVNFGGFLDKREGAPGFAGGEAFEPRGLGGVGAAVGDHVAGEDGREEGAGHEG